MAKKITLKKILRAFVSASSVIAVVAIGTLFTSGAFLNATLLKLIPQIGHTIVGWVIIISGLAAGLGMLVGKK